MTGWLSGAGDDTVANVVGGGVGAWRGSPCTYARIWADTTDAAQRWPGMADAFRDWPGRVDVAAGGIATDRVPLENIYRAGIGALRERWRAQLGYLRDRGPKLLDLSPFHEANGVWYPWSLTNDERVEHFPRAFNLWAATARAILPDARIVWCLNSANVAGVDLAALAPLLDFDVLGVDLYNGGPEVSTEQQWRDWTSTSWNGGPRGFDAWAAFARSLGVPLSFPEWGLCSARQTDNPFWATRMHRAFSSIAPADPAAPKGGELAGEAYFFAGGFTRLWPTTAAPRTAAAFRALSWP